MENENITSEKKNTRVEFALFLILGFLLGVVIKTEAAKRITIGYNDYQLSGGRAIYNINELQKKIMEEKNNQKAEEKQGQDQNNPNNQPAAEGTETSQ